MATVADIIKMIMGLPADERKVLKSALLNTSFSGSSDMNDLLSKERFANGRVCPICGSTHVVRNGRRADGTQKFMCRDCKKYFVVASNSIVSGTRKDLSVWEKYISCMMQGLSLRKTAVVCGISKNTAFYWRHKILDALQNMADEVTLNGIVEADETFFSVSYKGNHKHSKTFVMPRKSHHRGNQTHTRGLSREKVCVPCAVNRSGLSVAKVSNLGRVSTKNLHSLFDGRIAEDSTLVTDEMNSYIKFADKNSLHLIQLKKGKEKKGIYHIQNINNYHSRLKKFMSNFNGVSTKYLNNYLIWHNFMNYAKETDVEKYNILMKFALTTTKRETCEQISLRMPIPVLL